MAEKFHPALALEVVHNMDASIPAEMTAKFGEFGWRSRAHKAVTDEGKITVHFYSDTLDLKAKIAVETAIGETLKAQFGANLEVTTFFERKDKSAGGESAASAAARAQAKQQAGGHSHSHGHSHAPAAASKTDEKGRRSIDGVRHIVAVASGKGGVGKSTVSVNLAVALYNQGYKVGILDADIYGPSLPMMLGVTSDPKVNDKNKIVPPEAFGLKVMSFGFFAPAESAVIWRGPMIMKALQQFFYDVDWGELDFLIIDLPPGTGDAQLTLVQSLPIAGAVIVTTPQNVALADAVKGIVMFQKTEVPIIGVVENMSTYQCPSCGTESHIFGQGGADKVSAKYDIPVLGHVPLLPEIRAAGDDGKPLASQNGHAIRTRFAEIAEKTVARLFKIKG